MCARIITGMQVLKRNPLPHSPLLWLMLLATLWACLGAQTLGLKTASGQIYGLESASWESTLLPAAPRLGLRALEGESLSAPPVGAKGGAVAIENTVSGPGRVQTRINVANGPTETTPLRNSGSPVSAGFDHVVTGHFDVPVTNSRSVFSISPTELKGVLQSKTVVNSPVTALGDGQFVRTVDVGRTIGTSTLKEGGAPTSFIKIFTDRAGNLITAFPVGGGK